MAEDFLIFVLAILTTLAGIALLVMLARRRREQRQAAAFEAAARAAEAAQEAAAAKKKAERRAIDDYAIPVSFDSPQRKHDDEDDIGKICPACGSRYGSHHRVCERDNSELAALN